MGLLRNQEYWTHVANRMFDQRPMDNSENMEAQRALEVLRLSCKSLSDLSNDPELSGDLMSIQNRLKEQEPGGVEFNQFLEEFGRAEVAIAMQAGIDAGPAMAMGGYARRMAELLSLERPGQFEPELFLENLAKTREYACAAAKDIEMGLAKLDGVPIWKRVWLGTKGVVIVSTNVCVPAGVSILEPFSGAATGYTMSKSIRSGEKLMSQAWTGTVEV